MKRQRVFQTERLRRLLQVGPKREALASVGTPHIEIPTASRVQTPQLPLGEGRRRLIATLERWSRLNAPLPEELIRHGLVTMQISREALGEAVRFDDGGCQRTRIYACAHFEVLVTSWRSGQATPIHDNGESTCGMLVVEGTATETVFEASPCGKLLPVRSLEIHQGTVGLIRKRDVHLIANLQRREDDLVSLHVYSPPLGHCRDRRLSETVFDEHDAALDRRPAIWTVPIPS